MFLVFHKTRWSWPSGLLLFTLLSVTISLLAYPSPIQSQRHQLSTLPPQSQSATVAQVWMDLLYERVSVIGIYPPTAARIYAYSTVALYESIAAGSDSLPTLGGRLNEMPAMPQPNPDDSYDWPSVANAAIATVSEPLLNESPTRTLYNSTQRSLIRHRIQRLRKQIEMERLQKADKITIDNSIALGNQIGAAILAWSATDGFDKTRTMNYSVPLGEPSFWVPIPANIPPIEPYWSQLRPFVLASGEECNVPLGVEFSTEITSPFYRQALEVYQLSIKLSDEERSIADFWDDQAGEAGMHPGHWMLIATQIIEQLGLSLADAAQMLMLVGISLHDSGISAWHMKYDTLLIRPESYIQRYIDPAWEPYLDTPAFPEYPSGHATFGAASAEILTELLGIVAFTDNAGVVDGMGRARTFTSFEAAAYENGLSRLYGGIHYRAGMEAGLRQGTCIGRQIWEKLYEF